MNPFQMSRLFVLLNHPMYLKKPYIVSILRETPLVTQIWKETKDGYLNSSQSERLGYYAGSMIRGMLLEFTPRTPGTGLPDPSPELREWEGTRPMELV